MKFLVALAVAAFILTSCSTSEETSADTQIDSTVTKADVDTVRVDDVPAEMVAIPFDSVVAERHFDETDSSTFLVLDNYLEEDIEVPANDMQVVGKTCAILVSPTDAQIQALRHKFGDDFFTIADDNSYYHGIAIEMLDSIDVETIYAEKPVITFKGDAQKTWNLGIRKEGAPAWNLIFFKTDKEPKIVSKEDLSHDRIIKYFGE